MHVGAPRSSSSFRGTESLPGSHPNTQDLIGVTLVCVLVEVVCRSRGGGLDGL